MRDESKQKLSGIQERVRESSKERVGIEEMTSADKLGKLGEWLEEFKGKAEEEFKREFQDLNHAELVEITSAMHAGMVVQAAAMAYKLVSDANPLT